tara:strand:- start:215 stop:556 length:342 start_codon:yes stop_codon:yes gene_type:complete
VVDQALPFRRSEEGLKVFVRVTPNAGADRIEDVMRSADGRAWLKVRVRAVPDKGLANKAVIAVLAKAWRVPKSSLGVIAGATDRNKTLQVGGDVEGAEMKISRWFDAHIADGR